MRCMLGAGEIPVVSSRDGKCAHRSMGAPLPGGTSPALGGGEYMRADRVSDEIGRHRSARTVGAPSRVLSAEVKTKRMRLGMFMLSEWLGARGRAAEGGPVEMGASDDSR